MFTYDRNLVAATFRGLHRDDTTVSEEELEAFDESLRVTFDKEVRKQAKKNHLDDDTFTLSWLVFFAAMSRAKKVTDKVEDGCEFFLSVDPLP